MSNDDNIITQCPDCKTQFRVTPGQLKVANGQVRCGNCLTVFPAISEQHNPSALNSATPQQALPHRNTPEPYNNKQQTKTTIQPSSSNKEAPPKPIKEAAVTAKKPIALDIKTAPDPSSPAPTLTIQREAVIIESAKKPPKQRSILWSVLLTVTLCGLIAQYLWFNRAELYWNDRYSPIYQTVCRYIDCKIAQQSNIALITNQQLAVKKHNAIDDAITVHMVLLNNAKYTQPYPAIALTFSDLKGRIVASRHFQPDSYLAAETDARLMPVNQPVQLSLELMSPGTRAVSYKLEVLAPDL